MNKLKSIVLGSMAVAALLVTGSAFAVHVSAGVASNLPIPMNSTPEFGLKFPSGNIQVFNGPIGPAPSWSRSWNLLAPKGTIVTPVLVFVGGVNSQTVCTVSAAVSSQTGLIDLGAAATTSANIIITKVGVDNNNKLTCNFTCTGSACLP